MARMLSGTSGKQIIVGAHYDTDPTSSTFDAFISQVNSGQISVPEPASVMGLAIAVGVGDLLTKHSSRQQAS